MVPSLLGGRPAQLQEKEVILHKPYAEWAIEYPRASGNPFDLEAKAVFRHEKTGATKKSLMFYAGEKRGDGDTWKFRFTGTKTGTWSVKTKGPGSLGGRKGSVDVTKGELERNGFFTTEKAGLGSGPGPARPSCRSSS